MTALPVVGHVNLARGFRGGERQTELLIQELSALGLKQQLICREGSPLAEHLQGTPNLTIHALVKKLDLRLNGHRFLKGECDILQAHEARACQWVYLHHLRYGTPYVTTRRVPEKIRDNLLNRAIYSHAAALVAISNSIAAYLQDTFKREVVTIPSACAHFEPQPEVAAALREEFKDGFVIGHVGALVDRHKGQSVILRAAALLKEDIPNLKLLFLGKGEDENLFREQARSLAIEDRLILRGFVSNVVDYLSAFDVFAFPSNFEGLGSVLLDVMEQGVPIVATRVDGIPDIVKDGESGVLIDRQDAGALAQAILRIRKDKAFREKLIAGGHRVAREHSPENMAQAYLRLYQGLLSH